MNTDAIIENTKQFVKNQLSSNCTGHDYQHALRVWAIARHIATIENANSFVIELAALLDDITDWKFNDGKLDASIQSVKTWLQQQAVDDTIIKQVIDILQNLSFKGAKVATPMPSLEGQIVQDADRLDAMGAVGIARTFAYGSQRGQPIHNPEIKPVQHESFAAYKAHRGTTINHFYEKLLLLKDRMNTTTAKQLANKKHQVMVDFLKQFDEECQAFMA